jgi:hypothetical protein
MPDQYLNIKVGLYLTQETILVNVLKQKGPFKKRDAKAWFRIDVNKVFLVDFRQRSSMIGSGRLVGFRPTKNGNAPMETRPPFD